MKWTPSVMIGLISIQHAARQETFYNMASVTVELTVTVVVKKDHNNCD